MAYDPLDADGDPFRPPEIPTLVFCLHCRQEYDSYRIEWRVSTNADGKPHGFWCCPIPGCGGLEFLRNFSNTSSNNGAVSTKDFKTCGSK